MSVVHPIHQPVPRWVRKAALSGAFWTMLLLAPMTTLADAPGTVGLGPATQPASLPTPAKSLPTAQELGLAPQLWIESLLPPKGPDLSLPSYADTIDRAQALEMAGQYRQALL